MRASVSPRVLLGAILLALATAVLAQSYQYDPAGRLISTQYDDGTVVRYAYDDNSNVVSVEVLTNDLFKDGFE